MQVGQIAGQPQLVAAKNGQRLFQRCQQLRAAAISRALAMHWSSEIAIESRHDGSW